MRYYKYCLRCGRRLKSEQARVVGYGKTCLEKAQRVHKNRLIDIEKSTCNK